MSLNLKLFQANDGKKYPYTSSGKYFVLKKMINDIFGEPPIMDRNSRAFKSWMKSEPMSIDKIVERSESRIKLESEFEIQTKVKERGPYT